MDLKRYDNLWTAFCTLLSLPDPEKCGESVNWKMCKNGWWVWGGNLYLRYNENPDSPASVIVHAKAMFVLNGESWHARPAWYDFVDGKLSPITNPMEDQSPHCTIDVPHNSAAIIEIIDALGESLVRSIGH